MHLIPNQIENLGKRMRQVVWVEQIAKLVWLASTRNLDLLDIEIKVTNHVFACFPEM
jgi:hypothetical protein